MPTSHSIPARGEVVYVDFHPRAGHEQDHRRPALVLTDQAYNRKAGLFIVCPITSAQKGYGFEYPVPPGFKVSGVILTDQVKSLDWKTRKSKYLCTLPLEVTEEVLEMIADLLQM